MSLRSKVAEVGDLYNRLLAREAGISQSEFDDAVFGSVVNTTREQFKILYQLYTSQTFGERTVDQEIQEKGTKDMKMEKL